MDKKAFEWKDLLKDRRLLGAGLAGLGAAAVGGGIAPGLIYKKPTWYSRLLMGGTSGILTALAVAAALNSQKAPQSSATKAGKELSSVGQNILDIAFPGPLSAAEQRQMGSWARALAGKGKGFVARTSRFLKGGLPDVGAYFGKPDTVKYKEEKGELPKYEYPNRFGAAAMDTLNALVGITAGKAHYNRLNKLWQNKQIAAQLQQLRPDLKDLIKPSGRRLLDKYLQSVEKPSIRNIPATLQQNLVQLPGAIPIIGKYLKGGKGLDSAAPLRQRGLEVLDKIRVRVPQGDATKGLRERLYQMAGKETRPSLGRKTWHGVKGGFRGLLVAGALAALQRGLYGRSDTRFLDSDVDILKDLQDNTNK